MEIQVKSESKECSILNFTVSPCILNHQVLFTPNYALFHTIMYQSFKLH